MRLNNQQLAARKLENREGHGRGAATHDQQPQGFSTDAARTGKQTLQRRPAVGGGYPQWENENTLISPIEGIVNFSQPLEEPPTATGQQGIDGD